MEEKDIKNLKELSDKYFIEYYNKNFCGKDMNSAIYDSCHHLIIEMSMIVIKFGFLHQSIYMIQKDPSYDSISPERKQNLQSMLESVEGLYNSLSNILINIVKGMKEVMEEDD